MADIYTEDGLTFSHTPLYVVADEKAVIQALLVEFSGRVEPHSNCAVRPNNWHADREELRVWIHNHFCGYGYHDGILSVEPLSMRFL